MENEFDCMLEVSVTAKTAGSAALQKTPPARESLSVFNFFVATTEDKFPEEQAKKIGSGTFSYLETTSILPCQAIPWSSRFSFE